MDIQYRNSVVFLDGAVPEQWINGTLVNGNTAIQNSDGSFLSIQPDGTQQTRPVIGPWESCSLSANANTVIYAATGISYPLPIRGR